MKKAILQALILIIAAPLLISCDTAKSDKLQVYASFYIVYDFTAKIAGEYADVYCVAPTGADAHDWEPTPKDMARIEQADIFFYLNPGMEAWAAKVAASVKDTPMVMISEALGGDLDPHVWLNPVYALEQMKRITDALIEADPANEAGYNKNYEAVKEKIAELDLEFKNAGLEGKTIITDHAAYGHLCKAYGMTQVSVDANNSGPDVSASRMAEIIEYIKENGFRHIFCGEYSNQSVIDVIVKESGVEKLYLNSCEFIYEEQLNNNEDYFTIMYKNLDSLKTGAH